MTRLRLRFPQSLRGRLVLFFGVCLLAAWVGAACLVWRVSSAYIDEFFDVQQLHMAERLALIDFGSLPGHVPDTRSLFRDLTGESERSEGGTGSDTLHFALFDTRGTLLLTDARGKESFDFRPGVHGFENAPIHGVAGIWRTVWLSSADGRFVVAVGQDLAYRQQIALRLLTLQLGPWLAVLPVLLLTLLWILERGFRPFRRLKQELDARRPEDTAPLHTPGLPLEITPLAGALNGLFHRMAAMISRERAFLDGAAHELRTPLAGLRIQTELAALSEGDPATLHEALGNLLSGIDHVTALAEQLIEFSRLDALRDAGTPLALSPVSWSGELDSALRGAGVRIRDKKLEIQVRSDPSAVQPPGHPLLVALLVRNIVNNAVLYTPEGGVIRIRLDARGLEVANTARPLAPDDAARLGESFFPAAGAG